jgi:hypothetical protein
MKQKIMAGIIIWLFLTTSCSMQKTASEVDGYLNYGKLYDLSTSHVVPKFAREIDKQNYNRLAGIYVSGDYNYLYSDISSFENEKYSWGNDYGLGKYATYIDYQDDKWAEYGGGSIEYFNIIKSDSNTITVDHGENTEPRIEVIKLKNNNLSRFDSYVLSKISGPDKPMYLLKEILQKKAFNQKKLSAKLIGPNDARKKIANAYIDLYLELKNGNIEKIMQRISRQSGLRFNLDSNPLKFVSERNEIENKLSNEINVLKNTDYLKVNNIYINQFRYLDVGKIYPLYNDSITIEMWENIYSMYSFVFQLNDGKYELVALIDGIDQE